MKQRPNTKEEHKREKYSIMTASIHKYNTRNRGREKKKRPRRSKERVREGQSETTCLHRCKAQGKRGRKKGEGIREANSTDFTPSLFFAAIITTSTSTHTPTSSN
jgi:hypothetical protein